ncbi:bifunctional diaminohydroxyphosphoribosylaminopyrimidine deaminase/5-amino-6-(5-phosphoribosylamino)uracil reductase RibD [Hymenobacter busanensis]|uniref:Riboflavin biosynthesis protein RibD n=1 Tax=Hymenobacter busanensis TaxID=2607656 RepID=A0A7L5A3J3_9BACT|nr:bifunctional diaminohydroxyphosphoribosylaminopyrimidine deaminase/5-amino-6-(5-phosphoribosylamino)uracil reductase RibD [Hymenobacter busanensis]KAA9331319.1 bifunctional diaminohydroxyphosphoribosylaminopyrimidine deaminase/5-amino-6-(5-phosphoribosylamino)uracil reductase RibD [Hymenobacter busanensis]QHJ08470.1 bifunctional diaminohydroxyphosphoribosylaminopyrimidine deaminase/5-amino-6-(5-phosphoribosylamino)uracil reductase RibD [Hymenobacter busanensis]
MAEPAPSFSPTDVLLMRRALDLALLGVGYARPNPMVGCVVADANGRVVGEGWHRQYGGPHAEVNALAAVPADVDLGQCRVYVTLEPCSHFGKTPPCADLLIAKGVRDVVVCNLDPNPLVAGRGIEKLRAAGIEVKTGLLEKEGRWLNRRFFTVQERQRPYFILKWAESTDGFVAGPEGQPVAISGPAAKMLVHRWRTEEQSIMVGTRTALNDNPQLNVREWPGPNPLRLVIDRNLTLPATHHLLDGSQPTVVYTHGQAEDADNRTYVSVPGSDDLLPAILDDLNARQVQSVLVEGGPALHQMLLNAGLWDEIRVLRSSTVRIGAGGVVAPPLSLTGLREQRTIGPDELFVFF